MDFMDVFCECVKLLGMIALGAVALAGTAVLTLSIALYLATVCG